MTTLRLIVTLAVLIQISGGVNGGHAGAAKTIKEITENWLQVNLQGNITVEDKEHETLATAIATNLIKVQEQPKSGGIRLVSSGAVSLLIFPSIKLGKEDVEALSEQKKLSLEENLRKLSEKLEVIRKKGILGKAFLAQRKRRDLIMCAVIISVDEFLQNYQKKFVAHQINAKMPSNGIPMSPKAILGTINHLEIRNGNAAILEKIFLIDRLTFTTIFDGSVKKLPETANGLPTDYRILAANVGETCGSALDIKLLKLTCGIHRKSSYGVASSTEGFLVIRGCCTSKKNRFQVSFGNTCKNSEPTFTDHSVNIFWDNQPYRNFILSYKDIIHGVVVFA